MTLRTLAASLAALMLLAGQAALAQTLDATQRKSIVEKAASAMRERYVFPEIGARAAAKLEGALAAGDYEAITTPIALAERLTADLKAAAPDGHLRVRSSVGTPAEPVPAPASATTPTEAGVTRADRLPGGVGYVEFVNFPGAAAMKPVIDKVMTELKDSRALIIDIRRHGGGSTDGPAYLASFFIDPAKPTLVYDLHRREPGAPERIVTPVMSAQTPVSFHGKPVFVLTAKRTISAGEAFAYTMQTHRLGTLVGETTAGAANGGGTIALSPQLSMFVPNFEPILPATKKSWEGTGVIPEVAVAPADALRVALERLGVPAGSTEVASLSAARVFAPRSTPQPGSEAMVRRAIAALARGEPDYALMAPGLAQATRTQLPSLQQTMAQLGAIQEVRFIRVANGVDVYQVRLENGVIEYGLALDGAGKISTANFRRVPAPSPQ